MVVGLVVACLDVPVSSTITIARPVNTNEVSGSCAFGFAVFTGCAGGFVGGLGSSVVWISVAVQALWCW